MKIRIFILILLTAFPLLLFSADNTDDSTDSLYYLKNSKHILKYRGTLSFVLNYMPYTIEINIKE